MRFKLNPTTLAVRRALAELPYEAKIRNDAPTPERTEAMKAKPRKKHVFWNREHITRLADAMFPKMLGVVEFPLSNKDRIGLIKIAEATQLECFSEDERGVITTERREKLIVALNRRYKKQLQATKPVPVEVVPVTTEKQGTEMAREIGKATGERIFNDPELTKSFLEGLFSNFAPKGK